MHLLEIDGYIIKVLLILRWKTGSSNTYSITQIYLENQKSEMVQVLILTSCRFIIVCPKSSAVLLKNVNIDVRINSGQFFTNDLASIPFTNTCKHLTVILTSAPKAASLDLKRLANLQNNAATISFSFKLAAPTLFVAVAIAIK